ncbi:hypothetical protein [Noviherbaspirillum massiliense]|uniref:hypothetical protein n=1 Tax=Noviherbaspirillum massiliense TaxID=1465823 RepID=UPI0003618048|nr:hypothetical protein [Noviherbaspirillum massiliense]
MIRTNGATIRATLKIMTIAGVLTLSACAALEQPKTREEFTKFVVDSPKMMLTDTYTVNRRFEDVVQSLDRRWQECYRITKSMSSSSGSVTTMQYRDTYIPFTHRISNSRAELTLQTSTIHMKMVNNVPTGGDYIMALDIDRLSANKTKLTWYSPALLGRWKEHWARNKKWGEGSNIGCNDEQEK